MPVNGCNHRGLSLPLPPFPDWLAPSLGAIFRAMPARWQPFLFPHLFPLARLPIRDRHIALPYRHSSLSAPMLSPNGLMSMLVVASTYYPYCTQTLPLVSGSRPILLFHVPFRWQLPADYRATVVFSPAPKSPSLRSHRDPSHKRTRELHYERK